MNIVELITTAADLDDYQAIASQTALVELDHLCAYRVSGDDAQSFLQGQLSNDVEKTAPSSATLQAYCTPKGRMLAIFYLAQWQHDYIMILPQEIAASIIQRLSMYVMRAQVKFELLTDTSLFGVVDPHGSVITELCSNQVLEDNYQSYSNEQTLCIRLAATPARYLMLTTASPNLTAQSFDHICKSNYWIYLDIINGIPSLSQSVQEAFVPQMTNLELIDGVSFKKGCYPGQEVVARLHYIGNSNRRMFRFSCASEHTVAAGNDIYDTNSQQVVGKVVSAVKQHEYLGLAVIRIENVKASSLTLHDATLVIHTLPYAVPLDKPDQKEL